MVLWGGGSSRALLQRCPGLGGDDPNPPPKGLHPHTRPQHRHGNAGAKVAGPKVTPGWLEPSCRVPDRVFLHKISQNSSFHSDGPGKAGVGRRRVALALTPVPPPSSASAMRMRDPPPRNFSFPERLCSPPVSARCRGKMAAPMSEGSPALEPGAAPYGNFPNYSRFHPPEGRVSLLPGGLLQSLFPAAARPLLGLDVGCNSGVRGRLGGQREGEAAGQQVWGEGKRGGGGRGCGGRLERFGGSRWSGVLGGL